MNREQYKQADRFARQRGLTRPYDGRTRLLNAAALYLTIAAESVRAEPRRKVAAPGERARETRMMEIRELIAEAKHNRERTYRTFEKGIRI